ncbi:MAG: tRNA (N6-threonylcarbamoyladenosine(37)-N6)-methyltransferase TrmO [Sedimentisphaerales bacterium]|nr:tRNA (N6-threonylcarbamoyladenosine(37)-N6)-methyltransferase TrmO [Sedimentisphaerales bacterium]
MSASSQAPVTYRPIGVIRSEHEAAERTPIQPVYARGVSGRAEILPEYIEGLRDLGGFSHLILLYHFHRAGPAQLIVQPFTDDKPRGLFSTRHPQRPNPIGLSVVRLLRIEGGTLHLEDVDILDGTPLLDIKPYILRFDGAAEPRSGWTETIDEDTAQRRGFRGFQPGGLS